MCDFFYISLAETAEHVMEYGNIPYVVEKVQNEVIKKIELNLTKH